MKLLVSDDLRGNIKKETPCPYCGSPVVSYYKEIDFDDTWSGLDEIKKRFPVYDPTLSPVCNSTKCHEKWYKA